MLSDHTEIVHCREVTSLLRSIISEVLSTGILEEQTDTAGYRGFAMRVSFSTFFLGLWMARHWHICRGTPYPKPSIAVAPNGVVIVGQSIWISCESHECQHAELFLYKEEPPFLLSSSVVKKPLQGNNTFLIHNAQLYQRGIYRCRYCCQSASDKLCSVVSDQVHINMKDPSRPKPFIKVRPREQITLGLNITIECGAPESDLNFYLYNSSGLVASQMTLPSRNITEFNFFMVGLEISGNYSCRYHHRSRPFLWSEPSDHVELLVTSQAQGITKPVGATTIILASTSAGVLLLLLLLLAFLLCRRRRKGFTANDRNQPVETPLQLNTGVVVEPEEITYAELSSCSSKTRQTTQPDTLNGSCVYTSVAQNKIRPRQ
ncbi:immunoglobulin superfamily member 1 isoform X3 [Anolis carolinensis]|uniref:immunoglobulin superfamily member 1 isoform X3 n=2 Tax=Anolis carolinensis TaxID=28377 RepID=UPI000462B69F|nr:PREDICTED: immunoglobulin superfamily member 1 isoform X3 [Anolis carolinensis]|eukprot:XP_008116686.1 PREDICTED: immunoglobulin superfamily member 1 isoform X3 [Anolis carolinensis]